MATANAPPPILTNILERPSTTSLAYDRRMVKASTTISKSQEKLQERVDWFTISTSQHLHLRDCGN